MGSHGRYGMGTKVREGSQSHSRNRRKLREREQSKGMRAKCVEVRGNKRAVEKEDNRMECGALNKSGDNDSVIACSAGYERSQLTSQIGRLNNQECLINCSTSGLRKLEETSNKTGSMSGNSRSSSEGSSRKSSRSRATTDTRTSRESRLTSFLGRDTDTDEESSQPSTKSSKSIISSKHSSIRGRNTKSRKTKSGMYDRHNDNIVRKMRWAHRSLDYAYHARDIDLKNLTFSQFIAGESKIIATTEDFDEEQGRLRLINKIAYAMDESNKWVACRDYYAAVVVAIELGEEEWSSNFRRFEFMLPRIIRGVGPPQVSKGGKTIRESGRKNRVPETVFCKPYQRGLCPMKSSHLGTYKDHPEQVMLNHYCAKCLLKRKERLQHPETAEECPSRRTGEQ